MASAASAPWVALLRGINVGKAKRLAMADLRALLDGLGYDSPTTVLNSGNAIFGAVGTEQAIAAAVREGIAREIGMDVKVIVRSAAELSKVVDSFPFATREIAPSRMLVGFAGGALAKTAPRALDRASLLPDELVLGDRVVYTCHPDGIASSKLPNLEKLFGADITARNWSVVQRLHDLVAARMSEKR